VAKNIVPTKRFPWKQRVERTLDPHDARIFITRADRRWRELADSVRALYGDATDEVLNRLVDVALNGAQARAAHLQLRDHEREIQPDWFQSESMIGYVCYTDRFAGTLNEIEQRLPYLEELGVTYLHLMPLLQAREGENDGGYAVADYDAVEPALGTMDDLQSLASCLHDRGVSLCIDLVVNHTAAEHPWATKAKAGDERYRNYYLVFDDRTLPDQYEQTLPLVFPTFKMTNFTWVEELGWVWTTFNEFQWDLNFANPDVLVELCEVMVRLANRGVDVLRLDAIPFTWKRLGTNCQNQPEAHHLARIFRAVVGIAAPATIIKAEAIVPPDDLVGYLGAATDRDGAQHAECDIAYNNQAMVLLWSSLASRDGRLMTHALHRLPDIPTTTTWVTYARCHDDIGWAIDDRDAAAVGWDGASHRQFLARFFAGEFPMSYARGEHFQINPVTGDARTSGSAAALCGIDDALARNDLAALARAERRLIAVYSMVFALGGIPLIYMGDELALGNDHSYVDDPEHAADNRWLHRPMMDWSAAKDRHDASTVPGHIFTTMSQLARVRAELPSLRGGGRCEPLFTNVQPLVALRRQHPTSSPLLVVVNWAEESVTLPVDLLSRGGVPGGNVVAASDPLDLSAPTVNLAGHGWAWISAEPVSTPAVGDRRQSAR
jgi:amylosucrase